MSVPSAASWSGRRAVVSQFVAAEHRVSRRSRGLRHGEIVVDTARRQGTAGVGDAHDTGE